MLGKETILCFEYFNIPAQTTFQFFTSIVKVLITCQEMLCSQNSILKILLLPHNHSKPLTSEVQ